MKSDDDLLLISERDDRDYSILSREEKLRLAALLRMRPNVWIHKCVDCGSTWWPGHRWPDRQICGCGGSVAGRKQEGIPTGIAWVGDEREVYGIECEA